MNLIQQRQQCNVFSGSKILDVFSVGDVPVSGSLTFRGIIIGLGQSVNESTFSDACLENYLLSLMRFSKDINSRVFGNNTRGRLDFALLSESMG
jgi:hypothetical protein